MLDTLMILADTVLGLALGYLFAVFRRREARNSTADAARNETEGNDNISANLRAGRNIKTVMPFDVEAQLCRMQEDKEWHRAQLAARDAFILDLLRKQQQPPVGFPLMNISSRKPISGSELN